MTDTSRPGTDNRNIPVSTKCFAMFLRYLDDVVRHQNVAATSWRYRKISCADRDFNTYAQQADDGLKFLLMPVRFHDPVS
ncbi:hypothetical protein AVEN_104104-1 [Araneus ventricosus]|uniref:Uncharacterized protein n=1 Tax=Araneus ventricosus TaxID=182803 RepID=A0A4Y2W5T0_ARAVE|nr:hypothetical protein AVEN_104104-1 [Araneus ventricosus]